MRKILSIVAFAFIATSSNGQGADSTQNITIKLICGSRQSDVANTPLWVVKYKSEEILINSAGVTLLQKFVTADNVIAKVLKGKEGQKVYGDAAKNGVIVLTLNDKLIADEKWVRLKDAAIK